MARVQPPDNQTGRVEVEQILCPICHRPNLPRARFCQHCGRDVVLNNDGPTYRITRIIKEGGQGAVYEVVDESGNVFAVKEMLERALDAKERDEAVERFELEANVLQRLSHPRIPRVYAHFKDEGRSYLAMDYVRGEDLEEILKREGAQPEARVLAVADQICDVLGYLHNNGLIYRDMKPSNVMIEPDGGVKLIDFGIAKVFQKSDRGTQIGTPGYAPPEQYQGIATVESDIYALGATLHHMLTGRDPRDEAPFSFPPVLTLAPLVSKRTADAISRALQMKPEDRFRSVAEFRAELRPLSTPTRQIRRAPATQAMPAPARSQAAPAVAARPAQQVPVAPAPVVPAPAQVPAQPAPRQGGGFFRAVGRFFRRLLINTMLVLLFAAALLVAAWYFVPDISQPLLRPYLPPAIVALLPGQSAPTPDVLTSQSFEAEVEATVPSGATAEEIRQALIAKYADAVKAKYGANALVNSNIPVTPVGSPELAATNADGTETYRATMTGWVQRPAQS